MFSYLISKSWSTEGRNQLWFLKNNTFSFVFHQCRNRKILQQYTIKQKSLQGGKSDESTWAKLTQKEVQSVEPYALFLRGELEQLHEFLLVLLLFEIFLIVCRHINIENVWGFVIFIEWPLSIVRSFNIIHFNSK